MHTGTYFISKQDQGRIFAKKKNCLLLCTFCIYSLGEQAAMSHFHKTLHCFHIGDYRGVVHDSLVIIHQGTCLAHTGISRATSTSTYRWPTFVVQSYPSYPNTFGQRGFIGCSDKRNCSDNPNETFLAIYILL